VGSDTSDHVLDLDERIAEVIHVPRHLGLEDATQVLKYQPGGHYWLHYDAVRLSQAGNNPAVLNGVQRLATFFYYLTDVEEGGETIFGMAGENGWKEDDNIMWSSCEKGYKIKPEKGTAILWYNLMAEGHMEGEIDPYSLHAGCDVVKGEKWSANKWIYNKKYGGKLYQ